MNQKSLLDWAEKLQDLFRVLVEAGLFHDSGNPGGQPGPPERALEIAEHIQLGREHVAASRLPEAAAELSAGEVILNNEVYSKGFLWRLFCWHQLHLFLYYVVFLILVLNVATGWIENIAETFWEVPMSALGLGALGAILRGLYYLHRQVARRIYRSTFILAHLCAPLIGALLGLVVYLIIKAGILTLDNGGAVDVGDSILPMALAFLAGFSWEWILKKLDETILAGSRSGGAAGGKSNSAGSAAPAPAAATTTPQNP